jgi:hypothetical protein
MYREGGVIFTQKNVFVKTYLKSPTSFPMRFWHFKCVKYANIRPLSEALPMVGLHLPQFSLGVQILRTGRAVPIYRGRIE